MLYILCILFQVCFLIMQINLSINKAWKNSICIFMEGWRRGGFLRLRLHKKKKSFQIFY